MSSTLESGSPAIAWGGVLLGTVLLAGSAIGALLLIRHATRPALKTEPDDVAGPSPLVASGDATASESDGEQTTGRPSLSRRRIIVAGSVAALLLLVAVPVLASRAGNTPTGLSTSTPVTTPPSTSNRSVSSPPPATSSPSPASPEPPAAPPPNRSATTPATTAVPAPPVNPAPNLILDPGFEATPPSWTTFGPKTVLTPVTMPRSGSRSMQITSTASGTVSTGATTQPVQVTTTAGKSYTATCWVRSATVVGAYVQVQEYTQTWQRVADPVASAKVTLDDPTRWVAVSVTYTATGSGNLLPLTVFSNSLRVNGGALLVDDCSVTST
jgi:hypothetical protein